MTPNEEQQRDLAENIAELKDMVASRAWKRYSAILTEQVDGRIDGIILTPAGSLDGAMVQEYAKGEVAGLKLALLIVPELIENMNSDYEAGEKLRSDKNERS
jgi:hypothetical protein